MGRREGGLGAVGEGYVEGLVEDEGEVLSNCVSKVV